MTDKSDINWSKFFAGLLLIVVLFGIVLPLFLTLVIQLWELAL